MYLLRLGCTLSPASLSVNPWLITWSTIVAQISLHRFGCLLCACPTPLPGLPLPLALPLPLPLPVCVHTLWLCLTNWFMWCVHLKAFALKLQGNYIIIHFCVKCIHLCLVFCKSLCVTFCKKCEADHVLSCANLGRCFAP